MTTPHVHGLEGPNRPRGVARLQRVTRHARHRELCRGFRIASEFVQHKQRLQQVLEDANVKLGSVVSDVLGESGRRMLLAIIAGQSDPVKLAITVGTHCGIDTPP